jgi:hypothetical protein
LYLSIFLRSLWRIGDEGSIVYGAQRVASGAIPYKDFFEVMGPGTFWWPALWFKLLGVSWLTSRLEILFTALGTALAMYVGTRRIQPRPTAAAVPALIYAILTVPFWPAANHHFDSNLFAVSAFALYVRHSGRRLDTFAVGVLAGLAATIMPQKGLATLGALVLSTALGRSQSKLDRHLHSFWMPIGFGTVGLSVLLFFYLHGALGDLVYANVLWPFSQYHQVNVLPYMYGVLEFRLPHWRSLLEALLPKDIARLTLGLISTPLLLVASLPFIAGVSVFGLVWSRFARPPESESSLPYWLSGVALCASECHRMDHMHLIYGSPILLMALAGPAPARLRALRQIVARVTVCGTIVLGGLLGLSASGPGVTVQTRQGLIHMPRRDDALDFILSNVPRNTPVFVYPYYPMYYFLADVRNPTRYSILMYGINTRAQFQDTIETLDAARVRFVLWDTLVAGSELTRWFPGYQDPPPSQQPLEMYLASHYDLVGTRGGFRILQRVD